MTAADQSASEHLLKRLLGPRTARDVRLTELLKPPNAWSPLGWHMAIPNFFDEALDIRQTERVKDKTHHLVWTQGTTFNFKAGDVLYDTRAAYDAWENAIAKIGLCVQVTASTAAGGALEDGTRSSGSISFDVLRPNRDRDALTKICAHSMTQDEFIRFLICGPGQTLQRRIDQPGHT